MKNFIEKVKVLIVNHIFLSVFIVTFILLVIDISDIFSAVTPISNISEHYDWLSYFGTIVGVIITVKIFEETLANDRRNRQQDFNENQKKIEEERRLNNKPVILLRSLTFNEFINKFNESEERNILGNVDRLIMTDSEHYISSNSKDKIIHLELNNIGFNHAMVIGYKINNGQTMEIDSIDTKVVVKKDSFSYITVPCSDTEFDNNEFKIYYKDIFGNCYLSLFCLNDPGKFEDEGGKLRYTGNITQKEFSNYQKDKSDNNGI
ncbi:hypothetical protein ACTGWK_04645 [Streptococcus suis]